MSMSSLRELSSTFLKSYRKVISLKISILDDLKLCLAVLFIIHEPAIILVNSTRIQPDLLPLAEYFLCEH